MDHEWSVGLYGNLICVIAYLDYEAADAPIDEDKLTEEVLAEVNMLNVPPHRHPHRHRHPSRRKRSS